MLDVAMSEVRLQCPCIVPFIGQRITARVPQHVRVRLEAKLRLAPCPLHHAGKPCHAERVTSLCDEYIRGRRLLLALEPPEGPQLIPEDRMGARSALLGPADVQRRGPKFHLLPS